MPVNATFTLEGTPSTGPIWRYHLESAGHRFCSGRSFSTGTVAFDTAGNFVAPAATRLRHRPDRHGGGHPVDRDARPVLRRERPIDGRIQRHHGRPGRVSAGHAEQLRGGQRRHVSGVFSNGLTRTLGQVALATFANDGGLVAESDNLLSAGPNSGPAAVSTPGTMGAGQFLRRGAGVVQRGPVTRVHWADYGEYRLPGRRAA